MAGIRTRVNDSGVEAWLGAVEPPGRGADARAVAALMRRVSGHEPKMWGSAIVGVGSYHYRYESGHQGEMCRLGLSPRKAAITLYLAGGHARFESILARLGKFTTGNGCLYIKRLSDVDLEVLEELLAASWACSLAAHPD
jgi:hypothetical protein